MTRFAKEFRDFINRVVKAFNTFGRREEKESESTEKNVLIEIRDLLARGRAPGPPGS